MGTLAVCARVNVRHGRMKAVLSQVIMVLRPFRDGTFAPGLISVVSSD